MVKRANIEFIEANEPITEPVTKFGGQPVWIEQPQWPLSRGTCKPMLFICQIALDPALFGGIPGKMAYLFMTNFDPDVVPTWNPESGENAVIIQPGEPPVVETKSLKSGPTLYRMVKKPGHQFLQPELSEFTVSLQTSEDPEFISDNALWNRTNDNSDNGEFDEQFHNQVGGNKIAGTPGFLQYDEFPEGGPWKLLLQLDSVKVPFYINFGDAGIGYAFISEDGRSGRFLWQCA